MKIGGLQKISLIDYPGMVCAVIFTQGCNFRCGYCHNPELVNPEYFSECISENELFAFLEKRIGKLDAVTITGGEPTIHGDLITFIKKIKTYNYLIKIDTNGSQTEVLKELIDKKLLDYIAMDIKGPTHKYDAVTGGKVDINKIEKSIGLIMKSGITYEFRTTIVKSLLEQSDVLKIGDFIKNASAFYLQNFNTAKTLNASFESEKSYSYDELEAMRMKLKENIQNVYIR